MGEGLRRPNFPYVFTLFLGGRMLKVMPFPALLQTLELMLQFTLRLMRR